MSAFISLGSAVIGSAESLAAFGRPLGYNEDGQYVEGSEHADAVDRVARFFHRQVALGDLTISADHRKDRRDSSVIADAAEIFWKNNLQQELSTIYRGPTSTQIMTGPDALLPIQATLRPGQIEMAWDVESPVGGASFVEPGAMRMLPMVGEYSERVTQGAHWTGIGYGADLIETWQAAEKGGTPIMQSRAANAMATLGRFNERLGIHGDAGHELAGLVTNSRSYKVSMGGNFVSLVADADGAQVKLQVLEHAFSRVASTYGGGMTTVVAPKTDLYALQRMRWTDDRPALPDFIAMHPWLANVRWIDGLQTAASTGGPVWIGMDVDPTELWFELSPTPLMYGPFSDGVLGSYFALISHIGGVILRRRERQIRYEFAA